MNFLPDVFFLSSDFCSGVTVVLPLPSKGWTQKCVVYWVETASSGIVCIAGSHSLLCDRVGDQQRPKVVEYTFCCMVVLNVCFGQLLHVFGEFCGLLYFVKLWFYCILWCFFMCILVCHCRHQCHCQVVIVVPYPNSEQTLLCHHFSCIAKESHIAPCLSAPFKFLVSEPQLGSQGCQGSIVMWCSLWCPQKRVSVAT